MPGSASKTILAAQLVSLAQIVTGGLEALEWSSFLPRRQTSRDVLVLFLLLPPLGKRQIL